MANTFISSLMISFERSLSKLSENRKIVEIGSIESSYGSERVPKPLIKREGGSLAFVSRIQLFWQLSLRACNL